MFLKNKRAVSLVELGIVLVVMAILVTSSLAFVKVISDSKIQAIGTDMYNYKKAVEAFYVDTGSLPGDLSAAGVKFDDYANIKSNCFNSATKGDNVIQIEESSCAMYELQALGFISEKVDANAATSGFIMAGQTAPFVEKNPDLAVHIVSAYATPSGGTSYPVEASMKTSSLVGFYNAPMVVVTAAQNTFAPLNGGIVPFFYGGVSSIAGLSTGKSKTLSDKIGSGLPYKGDLIFGRDLADAGPSASATDGCTLLSGPLAPNVVDHTATINVADTKAKCVIALKIMGYPKP